MEEAEQPQAIEGTHAFELPTELPLARMHSSSRFLSGDITQRRRGIPQNLPNEGLISFSLGMV
jgi:hypothetical protein